MIPIPDRLHNRFRREGLLQLERLFSAEEMWRVQIAFDEMLANPPEGVGIIPEDGDPRVVRSVMGWQRCDGVLSRFARDARIMDWIWAILGDEVVFHQTKYNPKAPNLRGEKWDPHRGDTFWCFKDGVPRSSGLLSVFVAITDQTESNGAVFAWPGSHQITIDEIKLHLRGLEREQNDGQDTARDLSLQIRPEKLEEIDRTYRRRELTGPAGTVWLLDAGLLHASAANRSDLVRALVANVYRRRDNKPQHPRSQEYLCEVSDVPIVAWSKDDPTP